MTQRQPYPGLRAFEREEADLFFGRERCTDAMLDRLARERFLAVLGASGSGKSSLVRTGLIEALELGLMPGGGTHWLVVVMRPSGAPFANLAAALLGGETAECEEVALLASFLRQGPRSLDLWCAEGHLSKGTKLLLLVDQFEELFRYADHAGLDEAQAFVTLLLSATKAVEPVHVVITMRSEFLGAATLLPGLAERINDSLYLPPRMTREEMESAIVGPSEVCGFSIEPPLVNRLLNDLARFAPWEEGGGASQQQALARRADQLPLMQHALNRLWLSAAGRGGRILLRLSDYDGGEALGNTVTAHACEVMAGLPDAAQPYVERVFRALVFGESVETALRRPTRLEDIIAICDGAADEVAAVVEAFRANGCNFLMPPPVVPLLGTTVVDLSHESLIRQWSDLGNWFEREAQAARGWERLLDQIDQEKNGSGELLAGRNLEAVEQRWREEAPNPAWAARYGGRFEEAEEFRARSRQREKAATKQRRLWKRASLLGGGTVILFAGAAGALLANTYIFEPQIATRNTELLHALENAQASRNQAEERLLRAERAEADARQVADIARRAARSLATDLVADLRNREGMRIELARDLLREADNTLDSLLQRDPDNGDLLEARAVVNLELANLHRNLFASNAQRQAASTALSLYGKALDNQPPNAERQGGQADAFERLGDALRDGRPPDWDGAVSAFSTALRIRQELATEQPDNLVWRRSIAVIHDRIATLRRGQSRFDEAEAEYRAARQISEELLDKDPSNSTWRRDLAWTLQGSAEVERGRRRAEPAFRLLREARLHFERLSRAAPNNTQVLRDLSFNFMATGHVFRDQRNAEAALREYQEAWRLRERVAGSDQANARWQLEAIDIRVSLGEIARLLRRPAEAQMQGEAAISMVRQLEERFPGETWMAPARRRAQALQNNARRR